MTDVMDPAQYLSKTNTTFLVGDVWNTLTGCNTLASAHFGSPLSGDKTANMTMGYLSHSVDEFLFNINNVPDIFAKGAAAHLCVEPEIHFTTHQDSRYPTIHNNSRLFENERTEPELVIMNATESIFSWYYYEFFVGEPLSVGRFLCETVRYDWKHGDKIQNRTYDVSYAGNTTKQLLKLDGSQSITNLSIACVRTLEFQQPVHQDLPSGSMSQSSYTLVQLITVLLATLVVALA